MKILITGHQGFIGSNMFDSLSKSHTIFTYEWGDPLPNIKGLDWVIHIGAISSTTERDVEKVMKQNYDFSCWLLDSCIDSGVNFQYSSSASVYGFNKDFRESASVDPRTPYAWSKYLFERYANSLIDLATTKGTYIQGFRYFNVYGPGESHKGDQASPYEKFKQQFQKHGYITVFENSEKYLRDFVPVEQVINVHEEFLNVPESGIWNIGTGKAISFQSVAESFNAPIKIIPMPETLKNSYQEYTCADLTNLTETLDRYRLK